MLTLNDYQLLADSTSGSHGPDDHLACFLKFLGFDAPAADVLASELTVQPQEEGEPQRLRLLTAALGLAGEAGEFVDRLKKIVRHGHEFDRDKLVDELGDAQWYIAELATALGVSLDEVARRNVNKLRVRYPQGFSCEASKNRVA